MRIALLVLVGVVTAATPAANAGGAAKGSPAAKLAAIKSFPEALAYAKTLFADTEDDMNLGAVLFANWSVKNAKLSDFKVAKNETRHGLVLKDSDAARGKRLCINALVGSIEKMASGVFQVVMAAEGKAYIALSAGDTGDIEADSRAKFCGVVVGISAFSNASGRVKAVNLVGMFDL
jgi:hypothetical protein